MHDACGYTHMNERAKLLKIIINKKYFALLLHFLRIRHTFVKPTAQLSQKSGKL